MHSRLFILPLIFLLASCTEKGPAIDFSEPVVGERDTTYLAAREATTARTVLLEEFTGVTCPNCPAGHATVAALQAANPGRVIAISYYPFGAAQSEPVPGLTQQDFRTEDATSIVSSIFGGLSGLPSASVDRMPHGGATELLMLSSSTWAGPVNARLTAAPPLNLSIASVYEEAGRRVVVTVRVAYTAAVSRKHNLSLLLVENGLVDAQEYPDRIDTTYDFKHVFRDYATPLAGVPVLDSLATKEAGRVYERTFVYTLPAGWNPDGCRWVAAVHSTEAGDREVLAAAEGELK